METEWNNDLIDEQVSIDKGPRPVFITVLCILTWIYSGFIDFMMGLYQYLTFDSKMAQLISQQDLLEDQKEMMLNNIDSSNPGEQFAANIMDSAIDIIPLAIEYGKTLNLVAVLCGITCIVAAVLMFKQLKVGFFLYVASLIAYVGIPVYLVGDNMLMLSGSLLGGFFGLVFIILYGVNLKHMK